MAKVALVIDANGSYGRGLLRGIARFAHSNGQWEVTYEEWFEGDDLPRGLARGRYQGVLCRIRNPRQFIPLQRLHIPIVDLGSMDSSGAIVHIHGDHRVIAGLAAGHLIQCGVSAFGYCGFAGRRFSLRRAVEFEEHLRQHGAATSVLLLPNCDRDHMTPASQNRLRAWLEWLPKPAGIMACNDLCGRQVLAACQQSGIKVPEDVAVVGVDNDEVLCELAIPSMTSVDPAAQRIGFEAAELLESMMRGEPPVMRYILVAPSEIVTRTSTDRIAAQDPTLVLALRYIRDQAGNGLSMKDLLNFLNERGFPISRSTLERRFLATLHHLPHHEITRMRLQRIERLLRNTEYPLWRVAELTGFNSEPQLNHFFKRYRGMTPGVFRVKPPMPQLAIRAHDPACPAAPATGSRGGRFPRAWSFTADGVLGHAPSAENEIASLE